MRRQVVVALKHLSEFGANECKRVEGFKGLTGHACKRLLGGCAPFLAHGHEMANHGNEQKWPRNSANTRQLAAKTLSWPRNVCQRAKNANFKVHESSRKFTPKHRSLESFSRKFTQVHPPPPQTPKTTRKKRTTKSGGASPEIS